MQQMARVSIKCIQWDKLMCNDKAIGKMIPVNTSRCYSVFTGEICCLIEIHRQIIQVSGDDTMGVQRVRK
jgi:hypothetical protein